jgi:hypothetical protein
MSDDRTPAVPDFYYDRKHANASAVMLLEAAGFSTGDIERLLGGRRLRWFPELDRELWARWGDGRDFDALQAEEEERIERDRQNPAAFNARRRASRGHLTIFAVLGRTREETEEKLGGPIDPVLWARAVQDAAGYRRRRDGSAPRRRLAAPSASTGRSSWTYWPMRAELSRRGRRPRARTSPWMSGGRRRR